MAKLVIGKNLTGNVLLLRIDLAVGRLRTALAAVRRLNANEYILKKPLALPMPLAFLANTLENRKVTFRPAREVHTFCVKLTLS